jgi:hypothetical protein
VVVSLSYKEWKFALNEPADRSRSSGVSMFPVVLKNEGAAVLIPESRLSIAMAATKPNMRFLTDQLSLLEIVRRYGPPVLRIPAAVHVSLTGITRFMHRQSMHPDDRHSAD